MSHVREHNMLLRVPRPDSPDPLLLVGNPIKLSAHPHEPPRRWPTLGEHTEEVLQTELGLRDADLADLRSRGAIGGKSGVSE